MFILFQFGDTLVYYDSVCIFIAFFLQIVFWVNKYA